MAHLERACFHIVFTPFVHILQVGGSALAPPTLPVIRVVLRNTEADAERLFGGSENVHIFHELNPELKVRNL